MLRHTHKPLLCAGGRWELLSLINRRPVSFPLDTSYFSAISQLSCLWKASGRDGMQGRDHNPGTKAGSWTASCSGPLPPPTPLCLTSILLVPCPLLERIFLMLCRSGTLHLEASFANHVSYSFSWPRTCSHPYQPQAGLRLAGRRHKYVDSGLQSTPRLWTGCRWLAAAPCQPAFPELHILLSTSEQENVSFWFRLDTRYHQHGAGRCAWDGSIPSSSWPSPLPTTGALLLFVICLAPVPWCLRELQSGRPVTYLSTNCCGFALLNPVPPPRYLCLLLPRALGNARITLLGHPTEGSTAPKSQIDSTAVRMVAPLPAEMRASTIAAQGRLPGAEVPCAWRPRQGRQDGTPFS